MPKKKTWRRAGIELYFGDALEILPRLPAAIVDALITDPPYNSGGLVRGDRLAPTSLKYSASNCLPEFTGDTRDQRGYLAWSTLWLIGALRLIVPGGLAAVFTDWRQLPTTSDAFQAAGWTWRGIGVWQKTNPRPALGRYANQCEYVIWGTNGPRPITGHYAAGAITHAIIPTRRREHIAQKPAAVMEWLLGPVPDGGLVLDPFSGSASTAIACIETGRRFIGIEKDAATFARACLRIGRHLEGRGRRAA